MVSTLVAIGGIVLTIVLLGCSAFFSSTETAVFSLPADWIDSESESGDPRASALRDLQADPHRLLVTLLVGNNVVNVAIASVVTVLVSSYLPAGLAIVVATVLGSSVVLIFGEIVPKSYGLANARDWSLRVAIPVTRVEFVLSPLIGLFDAITRRINARLSATEAIERIYLE